MGLMLISTANTKRQLNNNNKRECKMKKLFLSIVVVASLIGCSNKIDFSQIQSRDGKFYEVNNAEPYTGIIEGYLQAEESKKLKFPESFAEDIYYYDKDLTYTINIKNGLIDGEVIAKEKKGQQVVKDNYTNGKLEGVSERFFKNGQLRYSIIYKDGKIDGEVKKYDQNGSLSVEEKYDNGNLLYQAYYSTDGTKEKEFDFAQKKATYVVCGEKYEVLWYSWENNNKVLEICDYKTFKHFNKERNEYESYSTRMARAINPNDEMNIIIFYELSLFHKTIETVICEGRSL